MARRINVSFKLDVPDGTSDDDIQEWLEFELNANGRISGSNPLAGAPLEPVNFSVDWED